MNHVGSKTGLVRQEEAVGMRFGVGKKEKKKKHCLVPPLKLRAFLSSLVSMASASPATHQLRHCLQDLVALKFFVLTIWTKFSKGLASVVSSQVSIAKKHTQIVANLMLVRCFVPWLYVTIEEIAMLYSVTSRDFFFFSHANSNCLKSNEFRTVNIHFITYRKKIYVILFIPD